MKADQLSGPDAAGKIQLRLSFDKASGPVEFVIISTDCGDSLVPVVVKIDVPQ
jgi:hypothetical protein